MGVGKAKKGTDWGAVLGHFLSVGDFCKKKNEHWIWSWAHLMLLVAIESFVTRGDPMCAEKNRAIGFSRL